MDLFERVVVVSVEGLDTGEQVRLDDVYVVIQLVDGGRIGPADLLDVPKCVHEVRLEGVVLLAHFFQFGPHVAQFEVDTLELALAVADEFVDFVLDVAYFDLHFLLPLVVVL